MSSQVTLRVFNVPETKTREELELEFSHLNISIVSLTLPMKTEQNNAGYAVVEFENDSDKSEFARHFPVLRRDLVIYKELSDSA